MKLGRIDWRSFRLPVAAAFTTAHGALPNREGLLVTLTAEDGGYGVGEASPLRDFGGGTVAEAHAQIEALAPGLLGQEMAPGRPLALRRATGGRPLAAVRCALDSAWCDIIARQQDVLVAALLASAPLGGTGNLTASTVPVNAVIGAADTSTAARDAASATACGFRCVKLKVGMLASPAQEAARVAAVRTAIGSDVALRLDANGAWSVEQAIATIDRCAAYRIDLVEQPVPAGNIEALGHVRRAVGVAVAADESLTDMEALDRLLATGAVDAVVIKPMVVGGPIAARRIAARASAGGLGVMVTTTIDSGVGIAAALHVAASLPPPVLPCGLATGALLVTDLLSQPLGIVNGAMALPDAPGLGVTVDERSLAAWIGPYRGSVTSKGSRGA